MTTPTENLLKNEAQSYPLSYDVDLNPSHNLLNKCPPWCRW